MGWYIAIGIGITIFTIILIVLWHKKQKYTRERYAFFATALIFTYALSVLTHIFADISLIKIFIIIINTLPIPIENIEVSSSTWSDKLWSLVILGILSSFCYSTFTTWGLVGELSKLDKMKKEVSEDFNFFYAAYLGMSLSAIERYDLKEHKKETNKTNKHALSFLDQPKDWRTESIELLKMHNQHYSITEDTWHQDIECYFSEFANKPLLVVCTLEMPNNNYIKERLNRFTEVTENDSYNVIILAKKIESSTKTINLDGQTIACHSKESLLGNLIDFKEYNSYLRHQFYESEILEGYDIKLNDIYTESCGSLTELDKNKEDVPIQSVESYLMEWSSSKNNEEQIALLGDYGQGKSVLSLKFANELLASNINRQPIIIELRGKSPRNTPINEIVAAWAQQFNYNVKAILKLLQEGRLVIILEGFDELDMVGDKLRRLEHFKKLWEFSRYKKSKVLITGRPNLFLNNDEARNYLQIGNGEKTTFHVKAIKLKPFDRGQIETALRSVSLSVRSEILLQYDQYEEGRGFSDLIARPSTLFQTSIIWNSLDKSNLNSSKIINSFIQHAYKRQAQKSLSVGGSFIEPSVLTTKEREYFMLGIAVGMIKLNGYSNQITGTELKKLVKLLFQNIPDCCSDDHVNESVSLRSRLRTNALDSVYNDVRASGILVRDLASHDSFKFAHKSFLEALFANFLRSKISPSNTETKLIVNTIVKSLSIKNAFALEINNEAVIHITESIGNSEKKFQDEDARSLLKTLSPNAILIDKFFLRGAMSYLIPLLLFFLAFLFNGIGVRNNNQTWMTILPTITFIYTLIFFLPYFLLQKKELLSTTTKIWAIACSQHFYDIKNEKVVSSNYLSWVNGKSPGLIGTCEHFIIYGYKSLRIIRANR